MFNNIHNEWEVINGQQDQSSTNVQVMEATVESNLGKHLEGAEITFKKLKITNNSTICEPSGTISKTNVKIYIYFFYNLL